MSSLNRAIRVIVPTDTFLYKEICPVIHHNALHESNGRRLPDTDRQRLLACLVSATEQMSAISASMFSKSGRRRFSTSVPKRSKITARYFMMKAGKASVT